MAGGIAVDAAGESAHKRLHEANPHTVGVESDVKRLCGWENVAVYVAVASVGLRHIGIEVERLLFVVEPSLHFGVAQCAAVIAYVLDI